MKFSENWLREWVSPPVDLDVLLSQLTMAGLEVEGTARAAAPMSNVVVAQIVSVEKHPNADKLNLCQLTDGTDNWSVICGAANVRAELKVALARIGAVLPGIKIKKAKLRGVESEGMICSASELQLTESSEGILELPVDAPIGMNLIEYLDLDDNIIEIDLTPNRGDCLSIAGVAREVSAINKMAIQNPVSAQIDELISDRFSIELEAPEYCPRYIGRIIKGIDPKATTPLWMQEKLRRSGLRPISPVVDITNYVMMEIGQPMHGFDFDKLQGGIRVRLANPAEKLMLLDKSDVECRENTLLIADHHGGVALAGIMGGLESSVQEATTNIFLEAAHFTSIKMAGKARSFGMHTDASHRFERGVDAQLPLLAMRRATELLLAIAGGKAGPVIDAVSEAHMPVSLPVTLRFLRVKRLLGIDVGRKDIVDMLEGLSMTVNENEQGWDVIPPSYRFDINIEADLIEEIGRMVGYNNIPGSSEVAHTQMAGFSERQIGVNQLRDALVERGYYEAVTYAFVSPEIQQLLDPGQKSLALSNPISSDMSVMRTSLLPGLIQAMQHNLNRQQSRVRLFETGMCFIPDGKELLQENYICGVISGERLGDGIYEQGDSVDFYDIKGDLESILRFCDDFGMSFAPAKRSVLHPGQSADLIRKGEVIGFLGALHPRLLIDLDLNQPVFVFEIKLSAILAANLPKFTEMSKFPSIRRDISLMVDADVAVQDLIDCIKEIKNEYLQEVFVFDVYTGKEVRNSRKSVALGLILQDFSRTLVEEDVEKSVEKVLSQLKENYNAVLRES
ncbi:MAG: phenylalanyl-tRNA synthetase beta chain [Gammaproteobacteria bacterium]|jgi:phenylalanyl-tRNA synthetase beta chain